MPMFHPSTLPATRGRNAVSVQKQPRRPADDGLPEYFGERLEQFMQASGLGPRPLGRLLGVSSYRVREWRRGVAPSGRYLFRLLTLAEDMGLREILTCPHRGASSEGDCAGQGTGDDVHRCGLGGTSESLGLGTVGGSQRVAPP